MSVKRTASVRVPENTLATIALYYEELDRAPPTLSALIARVINDYHTMLVQQNKMSPVLGEKEVLDTMERFGYTNNGRRDFAAPARSSKEAKRENMAALHAKAMQLMEKEQQ